MEQLNQFIEQIKTSGNGSLDGLIQPLKDLQTTFSIVAIAVLAFWIYGLISDFLQKRSISKIRKEVRQVNLKLDKIIAHQKSEDENQ